MGFEEVIQPKLSKLNILLLIMRECFHRVFQITMRRTYVLLVTGIVSEAMKLLGRVEA
jgi:hypothetical protein